MKELLKDEFYNYFKETFKEYELLSEYKNRDTPIKIKHLSCKHIFELTPRSIKNNKKSLLCPLCSRYELFISNLIKKYGNNPYIIERETYTDSNSKITVKCKICGNTFSMTPTNILNTKNKLPPCPICSTKRVSLFNTKSKEYYIDKLNKKFNNENPYKISNFINMSNKCTHLCIKCNHIFEAKPLNVLKSKFYCPTCNKRIRDDRPYSDRIKEISEGTIIPLGTYKNREIKIKHKCLKCGNIWEASPQNILSGTKCPKCANKITSSKGEDELNNFIFSIYNGKIISKTRKILHGKELDIYLPEKKIAIEYNGLFWHGEKYKDSNYHLNKTNECLKKDIRLIHIFEDEWINKNVIVKSKISNIIGSSFNLIKIAARKCNIKEIDSNLKKEFLEKNHIQGNDKSILNLGLFYNEELVSVMTFCELRKSLGNTNTKEGFYELSRFASNINLHVQGGFGKLFSYFINNYEFNEIITYADKRWSSSNTNIYNNLGFNLDHISKPNYWYVDKNNGKKRLYRYTYRKQNLKKLFPEFYDDTKTEKEIMELAGFYRIFDCGNFVYKFK